MIAGLPVYFSLLFGITVLLTLFLLLYASRSSKLFILAVVWLGIQTGLGITEFYVDPDFLPPKLVLGIIPTILFILLLFALPMGRRFMDCFQVRDLTLIHIVRIPVEIVLFLLYSEGLISVLMTFEGINFDILTGLSAAVIVLIMFRGKDPGRRFMIVWNILGLLLLLNVVITAAFAVPSPIQQWAFAQPNVAVMYWPFNLLPTFIVPVVLFAHLAALRKLHFS